MVNVNTVPFVKVCGLDIVIVIPSAFMPVTTITPEIPTPVTLSPTAMLEFADAITIVVLAVIAPFSLAVEVLKIRLPYIL